MNNTTTNTAATEVTNHCDVCGQQIANDSSEGCPDHPDAEVISVATPASARNKFLADLEALASTDWQILRDEVLALGDAAFSPPTEGGTLAAVLWYERDRGAEIIYRHWQSDRAPKATATAETPATARDGYHRIAEVDVPEGLRFSVEGRDAGQMIEVAYAGEYKRVHDRSLGPDAITYYRRAK